MTAGAHQHILTWVKVAYSSFVGIYVPCYWVTHSPWNFLYFRDVALLVTGVTSYMMLDPAIPAFPRGLSSFHG